MYFELEDGKDQAEDSRKAAHVKSFREEVSLVIMGFPQDDNENLMAKVKDLFCIGLECNPVAVPVAVEQTLGRRRQPGLVKVKLRLIREKVDGEKQNLKTSTISKESVSSAKLHAARLMDYNFRTLLSETPAGKDFYLAGNGRLAKRSPARGALVHNL